MTVAVTNRPVRATKPRRTRVDRQDEVLVGTFFPSAFDGDVSCSSFSEIRSGVGAKVWGDGSDDRTENLHPRAYRGDGNKRSLF